MIIIKKIKNSNFIIIAVFLNLLYVILGFSLVGCLIWHSRETYGLAVFRPAIAAAVFGAVIGVTAIYGAVAFTFQKRKLLTVYNVLMPTFLVVLGGLGAACLAADSSQMMPQLVKGWIAASVNDKADIQNALVCCGFEDPNLTADAPSGLGHPPCEKLSCCEHSPLSTVSCCTGWDPKPGEKCPCATCGMHLEVLMVHTIKVLGAMALVFALIVLIGSTYVIIQQLHQQRQEQLAAEQNNELTDEPCVQYQKF